MADMMERQLFLVFVRKMYMIHRRSFSNSPDSVIESTIKVYELLGAEYACFDVEGTQMTARVNPRTTLRTGIILYLHLIWKKFISLTKTQS